MMLYMVLLYDTIYDTIYDDSTQQIAVLGC